MKDKKILAGVIALLGVLCLVCGFLLLRGGPSPEPVPTATASPTAEPTAAPSPEPESSSESSQEEPYASPIDFPALQEGNPDIYAWLQIPGTEFDFPIVQRAGDDSFYLTHDSDGKESPAGAIFTESAYNTTTMEDLLTVAYGHQMHAGTMFGKLQETYSQENALEDYGEIVVYLPDKELHYTVFAAVPYDNRLKKVVLTDKALVYRQQVRQDLTQLEETLTQGIPPEDMEVFFRVIEMMMDNLAE